MIESVKIQVTEFLGYRKTIPLIDVRSPLEYKAGNIPGSVNIPLFSDFERSQVGITYAREGSIPAISKGMELIGPKLKDIVDSAAQVSPGKKLLLYCWRGGQRSSAMAWLLKQAGIDTYLLEGGYKAYRKHIRNLYAGYSLFVLSGYTGAGKTELLELLRTKGEQVIDLESIACHRGSAFGHLGTGPQPGNEQFENNLADAWMKLDQKSPVWLEDESQAIGSVNLPASLFREIFEAKIIRINADIEERTGRLVNEYGHFTADELCGSVSKLTRRLGPEKAALACSSIREGDPASAARTILSYYDKYYDKSFTGRNTVMEIDNSRDRDQESIINKLLNFVHNT